MCRIFVGLGLAILMMMGPAMLPAGEPIEVGIVGCDTSHAPAFTKLLNGPKPADSPLAGVTVVAAFPGGSDDLPASRDRVAKFAEEIRGQGVAIVGSIEELLPKVDAVLLMSVDGRVHLEQVRPVIAAGKPVFVDKPFTASLADAVTIFDLAESKHVPIFTSSALRFSPNVVGVAGGGEETEGVGDILGCVAYSPATLDPTHPDLFWYGIHGVETLYTIMGPGCVSVVRTKTPGTDVVTGVWADGRVGTFRGLRTGKHDYGALVFGAKGNRAVSGFGGYEPLVREVVTFFRTGKPPVEPGETLELLAFMEAADESARTGGAVAVADVLAQARQAAATRE